MSTEDIILEEVRATRSSLEKYIESHNTKHDVLIADLTRLQESSKDLSKFREEQEKDHDHLWTKVRGLDKDRIKWNAVSWVLAGLFSAAVTIYEIFKAIPPQKHP